jgi:hypothetical protein
MTAQADRAPWEARGLDLSEPTAGENRAALAAADAGGIGDGRPKGMPAARWAERCAQAERELLEERRVFEAWCSRFQSEYGTTSSREDPLLPANWRQVVAMWAQAGLSDALRTELVAASRGARHNRWAVLCALVERTLAEIHRRAAAQ